MPPLLLSTHFSHKYPAPIAACDSVRKGNPKPPSELTSLIISFWDGGRVRVNGDLHAPA